MISFADALTELSQQGGGHPAHAAMLLAGALAARRGSLPPVTEPDAWNIAEEELIRARTVLTKPAALPPYVPAPGPDAEPEHLVAEQVMPGDQLYCQGDMLSGHHRPGWCRVDVAGTQRRVGPGINAPELPSFGMSCGRLWTAQAPQEKLLVARRGQEALAS